VFQNLIDNAVKYMDKPSGGRIEISAGRCEQGWLFAVRDNGPGIPQGDLERIFSVFRRGSSDTINRIPGKGLGLALVKNIVCHYGGDVRVESRLGEGTTFELKFGSCCKCPQEGNLEPPVCIDPEDLPPNKGLADQICTVQAVPTSDRF